MITMQQLEQRLEQFRQEWKEKPTQRDVIERQVIMLKRLMERVARKGGVSNGSY